MTDIQEYERLPLIQAVRYESVDKVKEILESEDCTNGAIDPTTRATVLFFVAQRNNDDEAVQIANLLVEKYRICHANQKDRMNQTCLFYAARDGNSKLCEYLINHGCDANSKDNHLQTCLFYAAREGKTHTLSRLIDIGNADPNLADLNGQTAIFYAAREGKLDTVQALLERGANARIKDKQRRTAITFARQGGHVDVANLLKSVTNFSRSSSLMFSAQNSVNSNIFGISGNSNFSSNNSSYCKISGFSSGNFSSTAYNQSPLPSSCTSLSAVSLINGNVSMANENQIISSQPPEVSNVLSTTSVTTSSSSLPIISNKDSNISKNIAVNTNDSSCFSSASAIIPASNGCAEVVTETGTLLSSFSENALQISVGREEENVGVTNVHVLNGQNNLSSSSSHSSSSIIYSPPLTSSSPLPSSSSLHYETSISYSYNNNINNNNNYSSTMHHDGLRKKYRLQYRCSVLTDNNSTNNATIWLDAPLQKIEEFERLFPHIAIWQKDKQISESKPSNNPFIKEWYAAALTLVQDLSKYEGGHIFEKLVDVRKNNCPDYYEVVKQPTSFSCIKTKLRKYLYRCVQDFIADVHLVFHNCKLYNKIDTWVYLVGIQLEKYFNNQIIVRNFDKYIKQEKEILDELNSVSEENAKYKQESIAFLCHENKNNNILIEEERKIEEKCGNSNHNMYSDDRQNSFASFVSSCPAVVKKDKDDSNNNNVQITDKYSNLMSPQKQAKQEEREGRKIEEIKHYHKKLKLEKSKNVEDEEHEKFALKGAANKDEEKEEKQIEEENFVFHE